MKVTFTIGALTSLAALGCAPVASSGPKHIQIASHPGDSSVIDTAKFDLRVVSQAPVIKTTDQYEKFEKTLDASYTLKKFYDGDAKKAELLETRGMKNLDLSSAMERADIMVIFVVKADAPKISKEKNADLALSWLKRSKRNEFSFKISEDEKSDEAWTYVKKNLSWISIAYRDVAIKK